MITLESSVSSLITGWVLEINSATSSYVIYDIGFQIDSLRKRSLKAE